MFNGEFDKHRSNAQQNKFHAPLLQFDANFAGDFINQGCFFLPFQSNVQVGPKLKGLTSENKIGTKPQVG